MTKLKIKSINHGETKADKNRYCGPAVISAVTGLTTGEAARLIRHVSGRKSIKGSSVWEVTRSLGMCGVDSKRESFGLALGRSKGPTLAAWLKHTVKQRTADRVFLVVAGWHWQLVQGRRIVCGILGDPTSIRDKRVKRRARVAEVFELQSMGAITKPMAAAKPKRAAQPADGDRAKAKRLAAKLGFTIESQYDTYFDGSRQYMYWIDGADKYVDAGVVEYSCHYSWYDVLDSLRAIEAHKP